MSCQRIVSHAHDLFNERSIPLHEFCVNHIGLKDVRDGIFSIRQIPSAKLMKRGVLRLLTAHSIPSVLMVTDSGKYYDTYSSNIEIKIWNLMVYLWKQSLFIIPFEYYIDLYQMRC